MPVKTRPDEKTKEREPLLPGEEPHRWYAPERLCPSQREDAERQARP